MLLTNVNLWSVVGTWFAGIATIIAALIALYIARQSERVKLHVYVGIRTIMLPYPTQDFLAIGVTNLRQRTVTVTQIWWSIRRWWHFGPWKKRRKLFIIPLLPNYSPDQTPKTLKDGEQAMFLTGTLTPKDMKEFISEIQEMPIKNLRVMINTSTGYSKRVKPEKPLLDKLEELVRSLD